jgi:hypothetical protein
MLLTSGLPTLGAEAVRGRGAARRAAASAAAPAPTAARLRRRLVLTAAAPESANPSFDEGRANFADSFERKNEKRPPPTDPAPACDVDGNVDVPLVSEVRHASAQASCTAIGSAAAPAQPPARPLRAVRSAVLSA